MATLRDTHPSSPHSLSQWDSGHFVSLSSDRHSSRSAGPTILPLQFLFHDQHDTTRHVTSRHVSPILNPDTQSLSLSVSVSLAGCADTAQTLSLVTAPDPAGDAEPAGVSAGADTDTDTDTHPEWTTIGGGVTGCVRVTR